MLRNIALVACLAFSATASAITPGSLPTYGPVQNDAGNANFLAALSSLNAAFATPEASQPGSAFVYNLGNYTNGFSVLEAGVIAYDVRIWVVSHDSAYNNAIGITESFGDATVGTLVFGGSNGLLLGDYVDIPIGASGLVLPFALTGYTGEENVWYGSPTDNADGKSHIEFANAGVHAGSFWWAVALDDQFDNTVGSSDRDFNDLRLAFQFTPVRTPEPGTWALMFGFAAIAAFLWRRQTVLA